MGTPILKYTIREEAGTGGASKARRAGEVPAVLYSKGEVTQPVYLNTKELEKILSIYGGSSRIALDHEGKKCFAIIKEIQKNMLKNSLLHVDLQKLDENQKIRMTIPIYILNKEAVETLAEIVQIQQDEVEIQAYPRDLPEKIEVDASLLKDQANLTMKDLNIVGNTAIEILDDLENVVATLAYTSRPVETEEESVEEALV
ncbi:ribosomal 5S rRNA E-loop binding protein Ctc/L25/TL5 [Alkaliphilus metalliredigens QYMF]|uniref:Large ribosomal subunit protein bL25 n=1 Tax=Alkaliphilus metalliredigens (strain QYMF) TaxID=293826 RepID=A6TJB2_ALKMQ|nr:50S ribosomal protein L25 [Alkaliphilus metalliredigens]ABR46280.1 ribosomal 5S rRNA E-loop binding protein Ctc/L25/TL5 [Alkaliphilus metalliredigens QYMF]